MTQRQYILIAMAGSAALLLGAFAFQHLGGLAPCKMCIWQRWPHGIAFALGIVGLARPSLPVLLAGAVAAATSGAIGIYHTGVERGWWQGPTNCTAGDVSQLSSEDLLAQIMSAPLVRCDDVAWEMVGLSMASWNAIVSFGLAAIWLLAINGRRG